MITLDRRRVFGGGGELPYEKQYLTFEALEAGTFTLTIPATLGVNYLQSVSYSLDGGLTWTKTDNVASTQVVITTPSVQTGDKVLWKGIGISYSTGTGLSGAAKFTSAAKFKVYGNIMSLTHGDNFVNEYQVPNFFTPHLFRNVASSLFDVTNLILPATTLGNSCYRYMFYQSNIQTSPILPASILKNACYFHMFDGCAYLSSITMLATDTSATDCLSNWVNGVAASGTFTKKQGVTIPSGVNGIPSGWTVVDA